MKKRLSCKRIEGAAFIGNLYIVPCCYRDAGNFAPAFNGRELPVRDILEGRAAIRRALDDGTPCVCSGCSFLEYKDWPDDDAKHLFTDSVHITHHMRCNLACVYCSQSVFQNQRQVKEYNFLPLMEEIINGNHLSPQSVIHFGSGEPTTMPEFEALLQCIAEKTPNSIKVVSNGTVFSPVLHALLRAGRARLEVSLDCAAPGLYQNIKGHDCFTKAVANLHRYACDAVTLKYILMPENRAEGDGRTFLDLAEGLGISSVKITTDYIRLPIAPQELHRYTAMLALAEQRGLSASTILDEEVEMHRYMDFREELGKAVTTRRQHLSSRRGLEFPELGELIANDSLFVREVVSLFTGRFPEHGQQAELEGELDRAPSRFHFISTCHARFYDPQSEWLSRPLNYQTLWALYAVLWGKEPHAEEVNIWQGMQISLGHVLRGTILNKEFMDTLASGQGEKTVSRRETLLLHAILLGKLPDSEKEILRYCQFPSIAALAAHLRFSPAFSQLQHDLKPCRHMPLAGTKIADLGASSLRTVLPSWIAEGLEKYPDATIATFWKRWIAKQNTVLSEEYFPEQQSVLPVLWFGVGEMAKRMLPLIRPGKLDILAFIDETGASGTCFMGRPVITSLAQAAEWKQAHVMVCARPFELIRQKLREAGFQKERIVSLDIEVDAYALAFQENTFDALLEKCAGEHPVFSKGLEKRILRKSAWFHSMVSRWT
jgi:Molybdenum cofactor biosynthesis enzyme